MRLNRFVVLGRVGMDLYADPPGTRIEEASRFVSALGGSAGNIAVALARQGAEVALLARVSDDAVGRYCLAELGRYGVDTRHVGTEGGEARNSLAVTETRADACQVVLYRNGAADFELRPDDVARVDFSATAALVVTGTAMARQPSRDAALAAIAAARKCGALVVLDIDYRAYSWSSPDDAAEVCRAAAGLCDMVVGNDDEFTLLGGNQAAGEQLARRLAHETALVTVYKRGQAGCVTHTADYSFDTGIYAVAALKPMGAGDGFMGGLLAALAEGRPLEHAVRRGAATAAMIVAGVGCAPASPDRPALEEFMTTRDTRHAHRPA